MDHEKNQNKNEERFKRWTVRPLRYGYSEIEGVEARMNPNERRKMIIELLSQRRYDTIPNLMHEFNVSRSTIKRDITILLEEYPIISTAGYDGGLSLPDGYYVSKKHLTPKQVHAIHECIATASPELRPILVSILNDFAW